MSSQLWILAYRLGGRLYSDWFFGRNLSVWMNILYLPYFDRFLGGNLSVLDDMLDFDRFLDRILSYWMNMLYFGGIDRFC